jgi:hypothetical protein
MKAFLLKFILSITEKIFYLYPDFPPTSEPLIPIILRIIRQPPGMNEKSC